MGRIIQKQTPLLGTNIKNLRIQNNLRNRDVVTQLQLRGVEMNTSTYSKIENGKCGVPVGVLIALTDIFHCDFNTLFEQENKH